MSVQEIEVMNFFYFFFLSPHCRIRSRLYCRCSVSVGIWTQSTRGSVESEISLSSSQVVTAVGAWKKHLGTTLQLGIVSWCTLFERRVAQVHEDQCSLMLYNQTTSSEHNEQSNVPLLIYYQLLGRGNTTKWFLGTFWPHNPFRRFTSLPANLA